MVRLLAQNATGLSQSLVFALLVLVDVFVAILAWYIVSNRAGCLLTPKGPSLPEGTVSPPSFSLSQHSFGIFGAALFFATLYRARRSA